jgi:hypothetical protein
MIEQLQRMPEDAPVYVNRGLSGDDEFDFDVSLFGSEGENQKVVIW